MAKRRTERAGTAVRFTGAAGGTIYNWDGGELRVGEVAEVSLPLEAHWLALLESGDAELVEKGQ